MHRDRIRDMVRRDRDRLQVGVRLFFDSNVGQVSIMYVVKISEPRPTLPTKL